MGLMWCIIVEGMLLVEENEGSVRIRGLGVGFNLVEEEKIEGLIGAVDRGPRTGRPALKGKAYCFLQ